jgi:hypothetical protein
MSKRGCTLYSEQESLESMKEMLDSKQERLTKQQYFCFASAVPPAINYGW